MNAERQMQVVPRIDVAELRSTSMGNRLELEHMVSIRPVGPGNWSADGRHVSFIWPDRTGTPYLWVVSPKGGWPRRLAEVPVLVEATDGTDRRDVWGGPQWSPTDSRVAFLSRASSGKGASVWTVGLDGGQPLEVTRHPGFDDRTPRWSPDGKRIAFVGHRQGRDEIEVVASEGGLALQMTFGRWDNTDPAWSPDGRWIAFISQRSDRDLYSNNLFMVPSDGGELIRLTEDDTANDRSPAWSPDGSTIGFVSNRDDSDNIWHDV